MTYIMPGGHFPQICTEHSDSVVFPKKGILMAISDNTDTQLSGILGGKGLTLSQRIESVFFSDSHSLVLVGTMGDILVEISRHQCVCSGGGIPGMGSL